MNVTDPVTLAMLQFASQQRDQYANEMILMAGDIATDKERIKELETRVGELEAENADLRKPKEAT